MKTRILCIVMAATIGLPATAVLADLTATFSQGDLAAKATFVQDGTYLRVTLENIAASGARVPSDVLTGVFFDLDGVTLTPVRAVLGADSSVLYPQTGSGVDANGEVGGEFAYRDGLHGLPTGVHMTISSVGMGDLVGPPHLFPGSDLSPPNAPNGLNYGIVSGISPEANSKLTGSEPLIQNAVIFTLAGLPGDYCLADKLELYDVMFNYGTDFNPYGAPAPAAALLGGIGLSLVGLLQRRRS